VSCEEQMAALEARLHNTEVALLGVISLIDYLGLSGDPRIAAALADAAGRCGDLASMTTMKGKP